MGRLDRSPRANWVEKRGGLPDYIDRIAVHLHEGGMPISQAIAVAINAVKKACATGDLNYPGVQHENAGSQAEACAAVAQWEAMKSAHPQEEGLALADLASLPNPCTAPPATLAPDTLALAGSWNSMLHPRVPAGQAGGGKFASGSGGGKGKGAGKGKGKGGAKAKAKPKGKGAGKGGAGAKSKGAKGGAKGGGKAGAGAKAGKGASSAALAAQAQQVYQNFLQMNPKQRSEFLAGLTNPQLSAMWKVANAGNTNDPSTRAAMIAIKDQMAARSLTGAKGPTAINAAKAAAAAKTTAPGTVVVTAKKSRARKLSHPTDDTQVPDTTQVALAVPSATSGDGAAVTVNANLRQKYAKTGVALKDGSFPIPDHAHLRKALKAVGRAHPSKRSAVRAHIRKRAKALGVSLPGQSE